MKHYGLLVTVILSLSPIAYGKNARTLFLSDDKMQLISITPGRSTVLSFPSKPTKVIVGNQGLFAVEYVESDLAISALKSGVRSNLFVYLEGRRFAFDLKTVPDGGDEIVLVRDSREQKVKVKIKNE